MFTRAHTGIATHDLRQRHASVKAEYCTVRDREGSCSTPLSIYIYIYIHIYIHIYIYTYICVYTFVCMYRYFFKILLFSQCGIVRAPVAHHRQQTLTILKLTRILSAVDPPRLQPRGPPPTPCSSCLECLFTLSIVCGGGSCDSAVCSLAAHGHRFQLSRLFWARRASSLRILTPSTSRQSRPRACSTSCRACPWVTRQCTRYQHPLSSSHHPPPDQITQPLPTRKNPRFYDLVYVCGDRRLAWMAVCSVRFPRVAGAGVVFRIY